MDTEHCGEFIWQKAHAHAIGVSAKKLTSHVSNDPRRVPSLSMISLESPDVQSEERVKSTEQVAFQKRLLARMFDEDYQPVRRISLSNKFFG